MSNKYELLREILEQLESFEKRGGEDDLMAFSLYLRDQAYVNDATEDRDLFGNNGFSNYRSNPEVEFSILLTGLFRFAKHYLKKAFAKTAFKTIDEFGFLATLTREGNLMKNELINEHMLEMSSGSEIIKRLVRNGLVHEYPDQNDKRAKRVALTEKGRQEIFVAFGEMHKVSKIIRGNLQSHELKEALAVLNKLTFWHKHIHEQDKNATIEELHEKYVDY